MRRLLASVGIGNATVDTVLYTSEVHPGDEIEAEVAVEGGSVRHEVEGVDLDMETRAATPDGERELKVADLHVADGFPVEPDERRSEGTTLTVPRDTPVTFSDVDVWVETELSADLRVDPGDRDHLEVRPSDRMQAVIDAATEAALAFESTDVYAGPAYDRPFVQPFRFRAEGGPFADRLDSLDLFLREGETELAVLAAVDPAGDRPVGADERGRATLASADGDAAAALRDAIDRAP